MLVFPAANPKASDNLQIKLVLLIPASNPKASDSIVISVWGFLVTTNQTCE